MHQPNSARLTVTVKNYQHYLPKYLPLVHPSPLNYGWVKKIFGLKSKFYQTCGTGSQN
ncbi:hypothetical protein [Liquorilactobacillus vini]|uniref:hypothetical protein n=1 Tax=Liquorilactobacillus vini TaxID=238015 RepID=UPI002E1E0EE3